MAVVLKEHELSTLQDKINSWPGFERMSAEIRCRLEGMMADYDFIADRWPDVSAVVLRPNKHNRAKGHGPWTPFCAKNAEALAAFLREPEVFLCAETNVMVSHLDTRLEPVVMDIITSRNIPFYRIGPFVLKKTTSEKLKLSSVPPGFSLTSLKPEQSEMVTQNWPYKQTGEETEFYVREMIASMPSVALYNEDKSLVGYAITYHNGIPGMLHVMEEYRGQGHAKVIMSQLAALCLVKSKEVFVIIDPYNEPSIQLHNRIGFEIVPDVRIVWIMCNYT